jgi:undecaprenyl diphosphate synthase
MFGQSLLGGDLSAVELTPDNVSEIRRKNMQIPEPDLVVRTSGEMRLSGFPYGSHAEIVFVETKLPGLMPHEIGGALLEYTYRDVRKGK